MALLMSLLLVVFIALALVNFLNQWRLSQRLRRMRLLKLRKKLYELEDVITCLESILSTRDIAHLVNKEIIELLREIRRLSTGPNARIEKSIARAAERAGTLTGQNPSSQICYRKESDAQIAHTQHCLNEAAKLLRKQHARGRLTEETLQSQLQELAWASLMVSVASFIGQGLKAAMRGDNFGAQAFYKKAQYLLVGSAHPNPDRTRLIRELSELINGQRSDISRDLLTLEAAS